MSCSTERPGSFSQVKAKTSAPVGECSIQRRSPHAPHEPELALLGIGDRLRRPVGVQGVQLGLTSELERLLQIRLTVQLEPDRIIRDGRTFESANGYAAPSSGFSEFCSSCWVAMRSALRSAPRWLSFVTRRRRPRRKSWCSPARWRSSSISISGFCSGRCHAAPCPGGAELPADDGADAHLGRSGARKRDVRHFLDGDAVSLQPALRWLDIGTWLVGLCGMAMLALSCRE